MTLFESIYYDLLIEGKSPEEILSILKYKFKNVPEVIIDNVFKIDPTKKKSFTQWVLLHYDEEKHVVDDALQNGMLRKLFEYVQSHQDVQLTNYKSIEDALYLVSNIDLLSKDSDNKLANDFDIVYKSPEWVIAVPNTYEASHKLGENTDWCTAGYKFADGRGYYNRYLENFGGKYFINFDFRGSEHLNGVDYPFKRYQFHFESNQFMNAKDKPVDAEEIDMPSNVIKFYEEKGYDVNKITETDEERWERYYEERSEDGVYLNDDLEILQEWNDIMEFDPDGTYYYVYNVQMDDRDPISWDNVTKYPLYLDSSHEIIILNTNTRDTNTYEQGLPEFDGTQECEPMIIYSENRGYSVDTDIIYYKVFEVWGKIFVAYVMTGKTGSEFCITNENMSINEPIPFDVNDGISGMYINEDVQEIYGSYDSDFLIEIVWDNGYHSLYNINSYNNANLVVALDKPVNSELFTVDENGIIIGMLRDYNGEHISGEADNTEGQESKPKHFVEDIYYGDGINHDYAIVMMTDGKYNVYDKITKQIVFKQNFQEIKIKDDYPFAQEFGVIIGYGDDGKCAIYSIDYGKQLTPSFTVIQHFKDTGFFGAQNDRYENYIINNDYKVFGPFYGLTPYYYGNKIFVCVEKDDGNRVLNTDTGEIEFKELSRCTHFYNKNKIPIMFALNANNECLMVNFNTGKVLTTDIMINKKPYEITPGYVVLRFSSSGKENIVSLVNGNKILPFDVDDIYSHDCYDYEHKTPKDSGYYAFTNNSTEYILHFDGGNDYEILPTQDGIVTGQTTNIYNYCTDSRYPTISFTIHDSIDTQPIYVTYNYQQNLAFATNNRLAVAKALKTCSPEIQQRVMQALNPRKAQVVSAYNEMINRMKNLIK